jgi:hypothetical protein
MTQKRVIYRPTPAVDVAYERLRMAILKTTVAHTELGRAEHRVEQLRSGDMLNGGESVWLAFKRAKEKVAGIEAAEAHVRADFEAAVRRVQV